MSIDEMFKIHRVAKWIKNTRPFNMLPTRDSLHGERHTETESYGIYLFHANGNNKKAGVVILISDKIDFKIKNVTRDKTGHYIMLK